MARRFTWPWGRISPERRLEEIDRIIAKHKASMRILQAQTQEALRLHQKSIDALLDQKKIVAAFVNEDIRKRIMEQAFEIESAGVPVLDQISKAQSNEEIEEILEEARHKIDAQGLERGKTLPTSAAGGLGLFDDLGSDIEDIFGEE